jgi:hypothetical protein
MEGLRQRPAHLRLNVMTGARDELETLQDATRASDQLDLHFAAFDMDSHGSLPAERHAESHTILSSRRGRARDRVATCGKRYPDRSVVGSDDPRRERSDDNADARETNVMSLGQERDGDAYRSGDCQHEIRQEQRLSETSLGARFDDEPDVSPLSSLRVPRGTDRIRGQA